MQAQITCKSEKKNTELVHISSGGIEYAGTDPMQARREESQNLCIYPKGIEYASTREKVEIKIETKVTSRQKPH